MRARGPCGISPGFPGLSPAPGQVAHVLRTRPPRGSAPEGRLLARLACVRRAASVRPEPGSNSPSRTFEGARITSHVCADHLVATHSRTNKHAVEFSRCNAFAVGTTENHRA